MKAATTIVEPKEQLQVKPTKQASSPTKVTNRSDDSESEYSESDDE